MSTPRPGDLLIGTIDDGSYVISVVPRPPQLRFDTRDEAIATAREWASQNDVAIWEMDDARTFARLVMGRGDPRHPGG